MTGRMLWVYLGDREYGNQLMEQVATELLTENANLENLVVHVNEHGGWWLEWARGPEGEPVLVGTANGLASWPDERAVALHQHFKQCQTWENIGFIHRS